MEKLKLPSFLVVKTLSFALLISLMQACNQKVETITNPDVTENTISPELERALNNYETKKAELDSVINLISVYKESIRLEKVNAQNLSKELFKKNEDNPDYSAETSPEYKKIISDLEKAIDKIMIEMRPEEELALKLIDERDKAEKALEKIREEEEEEEELKKLIKE